MSLMEDEELKAKLEMLAQFMDDRRVVSLKIAGFELVMPTAGENLRPEDAKFVPSPKVSEEVIRAEEERRAAEVPLMERASTYPNGVVPRLPNLLKRNSRGRDAD